MRHCLQAEPPEQTENLWNSSLCSAGQAPGPPVCCLLNARGEAVLQSDHGNQMHSAVKLSHKARLTPCSRVCPDKLVVTLPVKKFPTFHRTQKFNMFTHAFHFTTISYNIWQDNEWLPQLVLTWQPTEEVLSITRKQTPIIKPSTSHFTDGYSSSHPPYGYQKCNWFLIYLMKLCQLHCSHTIKYEIAWTYWMISEECTWTQWWNIIRASTKTTEMSVMKDKLPAQQQWKCVFNQRALCPVTCDIVFVLTTSSSWHTLFNSINIYV